MNNALVTDVLIRVSDADQEQADGSVKIWQEGEVIDWRTENDRRMLYLEMAGLLANPHNRIHGLEGVRWRDELVRLWTPTIEAAARLCARTHSVNDDFWAFFRTRYEGAFGTTWDNGAAQLDVWPWAFHDEKVGHAIRVTDFSPAEAEDTTESVLDAGLLLRIRRRLSGKSNKVHRHRYVVPLSELGESPTRLEAIRDPRLHAAGRTSIIHSWPLLRREVAST